MTVYFIITGFLLSVMIAGCAGPRQSALPGKIFELQYHPVSGDVYSFQGTRFTVSAPLRTKGQTDYFYAIEKEPTPLKSPRKYQLFEINVHNPQRRYVRIDFTSIELVGSNNDRYKPLDTIVPDTNQTRNLLRTLDVGKETPFIYGLVAFEPVPDWEKKLTLRFHIQIDDLMENHFVIFEKDAPDQEAVVDYREDARQLQKRERLIQQYSDEEGYIKPSDLPKIQAVE